MSTNAELLPRELAPGIQWLGECYEMPYAGRLLHSYDSLFLVSGSEASLLVEAGLPLDREVTETQLERCVATAPELRYIFLSHQETPHAGGIGRLLALYPNAIAIGDVRDYHLFFPRFVDRFRMLTAGEAIDLGSVTFRALSAVVKDLPTTLWGHVPERGALFCGDGVAYAHHHHAGQCGKLAHELPELEIGTLGGLFVEQALNWLRFVDPEPYVLALHDLIEELAIKLVCPTHGLPITQVERSMADIYAGLRYARQVHE